MLFYWIFTILFWPVQSLDDALFRLSTISCKNDQMNVSLVIDSSQIKNVYLKNMKDFPSEKCKSKFSADKSTAIFKFSLKSKHDKCGLIRIHNQKTGTVTFRHEIVIEDINDTIHSTQIKCTLNPKRKSNGHILRKKREDGEFNFFENEDIEIVSNITKYAPEPIINAIVRQDGKVVRNELKVAPGTPLQMEIFLDKNSSAIYGLLVKHMSVSDSNVQDETLVFNGCAIDPFLFDNFKSDDGDVLSAKFKAFKFPETPYVMFFITVNVCLDKCQMVECNDGNFAYGKRKKRDINKPINDPNKIFEVSFTSFIKINYNHKLSNLISRDMNDNSMNSLRTKLIYGQQNPGQNKNLYDISSLPSSYSGPENISAMMQQLTNHSSSIQNFAFLKFYFFLINVFTLPFLIPMMYR